MIVRRSSAGRILHFPALQPTPDSKCSPGGQLGIYSGDMAVSQKISNSDPRFSEQSNSYKILGRWLATYQNYRWPQKAQSRRSNLNLGPRGFPNFWLRLFVQCTSKIEFKKCIKHFVGKSKCLTSWNHLYWDSSHVHFMFNLANMGSMLSII